MSEKKAGLDFELVSSTLVTSVQITCTTGALLLLWMEEKTN